MIPDALARKLELIFSVTYPLPVAANQASASDADSRSDPSQRGWSAVRGTGRAIRAGYCPCHLLVNSACIMRFSPFYGLLIRKHHATIGMTGLRAFGLGDDQFVQGS